jgi:chromosome segregation ATPase
MSASRARDAEARLAATISDLTEVQRVAATHAHRLQELEKSRERAVAEARAAHQQRSRDANTAERSHAVLRQQLNEVHRDRDRAQTTVETLEQSHSDAKRKGERLKQDAEDARHDAEDARHDVTRAEAERQDWQMRYEEAEKRHSALIADFERISAEYTTQRQDVVQLREQTHQTNQRLQASESLQSAMQTEIDEARTALDAAKKTSQISKRSPSSPSTLSAATPTPISAGARLADACGASKIEVRVGAHGAWQGCRIESNALTGSPKLEPNAMLNAIVSDLQQRMHHALGARRARAFAP